MIEHSLPSLASLYIEMTVREQHLSSGTAFVFEHDNKIALITNRHNLTGKSQNDGQPLSKTGGLPDTLHVWHYDQGAVGLSWRRRAIPLFVDEHPAWKEHPTLGGKADFVAVPLQPNDEVQFHSYKTRDMSESNGQSLAEVVSVIGFPFGKSAGGLLGIWATGFRASHPQIDFEGLPVFLIDCRSRPGQSGSPVIRYHNSGMNVIGAGLVYSSGPIFSLLGIYSGRIHPDSDIGMVWKASAIAELMASLE